MISAMPAVALRREGKRSKPALNRASSAASFGGQATNNSRATRAPSVSTLDIPHRIVRFKSREQEQREKLFMYCGTLCLVTGLFLLFIGVGVQVTPTRTVGLLFIALGAILCFVKVVITPEEPRRTPLRRQRLLGSTDSIYNLAVPGVTIKEPETDSAAAAGERSTSRKSRPTSKDKKDTDTPKHNNSGGTMYISVAIEESDQENNGCAPKG